MSVKVLIVDDTITYRKILSDIIGGISDAEVVATASNGSIALQKIEQNSVDLVLLDVNMPVMDGLETLKQIKKKYSNIHVVMVSSTNKDATQATIKALNVGALDFISKPDSSDAETSIRRLKSDITPVIRLIITRKNLSSSSEKTIQKTKTVASVVATPPKPYLQKIFGVVVIGISTGGPNALHSVIPKLPGNFPLPILIVQHMPPKFTDALAKDLDRKSEINVVEASDGMEIEAGKIILAQGGHHMVVREQNGKKIVAINDGPPENSCRPAVDVLFRSVANVYGDKGVLALIMTGMGSDGVAGVRTLKRKKCYCISQSEKSCVVYGMPRSLDEASLQDESVDLERISSRIVELVRG